MSETTYDLIGYGYAKTRQADPRIANRTFDSPLRVAGGKRPLARADRSATAKVEPRGQRGVSITLTHRNKPHVMTRSG
jgi:hypothetical protein